ncbi:glutamine amidotransferase [bacterium]|nr:glutamine amidotransferase [bacterium]
MKSKHKLKLVHLYPDLMNLYGDRGNVLCLQQRARWRGIDIEVVPVGVGMKLPEDYDLLFMGGGQDRGQELVADDLFQKGHQIKASIEAGLPALVICGGYQLFGHYFKTSAGKKLPGIGVFNAATDASNRRLIGNVVVRSQRFGKLVGFENHSGLTKLAASLEPLGQVVQGGGNNGEDGVEGALYKNAIGTYLHGSFLPKNPAVADFLISAALARAGYEAVLTELDDSLEKKASELASKRPQ